MICYRDKTFCPFSECVCFGICIDAYTDEVKAAAKMWWGGDYAPISLYTVKPECYEGPNNQRGKR